MAISDRLNKLTTDITNAYTSIENKGGTIPANKNTNNLPTAINSIEVIEQATAEGESISLVNTKAMPYSDYVVKGKSEQTTRSGKNLLQNTATSQTISGVTFTVNEDGSVTCNGTATNNIFFPLTGNTSIENIIINGCPAGGSGDSYLVRAIDTNGRVLKTDFGEGTEVFDLINARIQIRIAKDYICNNLTFYPMIRLATIEDDTYEPYGASPSPEYPSEIHSVADDVNLWNNELDNNVFNDNGIKEYSTIFVMNKVAIDVIPNTSYVVSQKEHPCQQRIIFLNNDTYLSRVNNTVDTTNGHTEFTFVTPENCNKIHIMFRTTVEVISTTGSYVIQPDDITNVKLQKGTTSTPYSPYNQGTVTIKQRGKNLWNNSNVTSTTIMTPNSNGGFKIQKVGNERISEEYSINIPANTNIAISSILKDYTTSNGAIYCQWIATDNTTIWTPNIYEGTTTTSFNKDIKGIIFYLQQTVNDGDYVEIEKLQIEKGSTATTYEPYNANDYTIQTEPLRSLPNGVKDTIEADGIHRRVGRIVLDGSENYSTNSSWNYTNTNGYICSFGNTSTDLLSNYFKYNSFAYGSDISGLMCIVWGNNLLLRIDKTIANDVNAFKTWLSTHNTEILYPLATETIEPLTQNQATTMLDIIKTGSYEGTTNIYTDEDVKPTIGVRYYKKS